jgi:hypothetical protein
VAQADAATAYAEKHAAGVANTGEELEERRHRILEEGNPMKKYTKVDRLISLAGRDITMPVVRRELISTDPDDLDDLERDLEEYDPHRQYSTESGDAEMSRRVQIVVAEIHNVCAFRKLSADCDGSVNAVRKVAELIAERPEQELRDILEYAQLSLRLPGLTIPAWKQLEGVERAVAGRLDSILRAGRRPIFGPML